MGFTYTPGPLQFLDPSLVPDVRIDGEMETVVAPAAANLTAAEGFTGVRLSEMAGAGIPDVHGETVAVLRPAYDEIQYQLGTLHELSTSPIVQAAGASLGEADRVRADLPSEDSRWDPPVVPGEGRTEPVAQPGPGEGRPPI